MLIGELLRVCVVMKFILIVLCVFDIVDMVMGEVVKVIY